jgi:hypothetical protein
LINFYNIKSKIINWFGDIRIYKGGIILFGSSYYKVKGWHMREILNTLVPGDILLRRYDNYLGSILIKGYWSHAAIYIGNNNVIHMLGEGITKEDILTFLRCDNICILRDRDADAVNTAIRMAEMYYEEKIEYDFDFKDGNKNLYCTELINNCFGNPVKSKGYIYPDDFVNNVFFDIIYKGI